METPQTNQSRATISAAHFAEAAAFLLREAFEGSPEGQPSAFLDRGVGFFNTIGGLSAEEASIDVHGTTAAAHTEHAKFYLDRICEFINGRTEAVNWEDSWLIETVDEKEWDALRATVRRSYESALMCLASTTEWDERTVGMSMGMIAHTAYHLGSIRQIAKAIK
jgi:hypothetical protein